MEIMEEDAAVQRITELDQNTNVMEESLDHLTQQLVSQAQQLVSLEEENASMKNELASLKASAGDGTIGRGRRGICRHSCTHHKALMDPAIWSNLPGDTLQMVLARLPLTEIIHLKCLYKEWCRIAKEPGFRQLCARAEPNPQMLAWVSEDDSEYTNFGTFAIRLWDNKSGKWHAFEVTTPHDQPFDTMLACDGGLVCFVSRMEDKVANPLIILVVNPLTREWRKLPSHSSLETVQPKMVHLVMDRNTKY